MTKATPASSVDKAADNRFSRYLQNSKMILEMLAIVGAAAWTLHHYRDIERITNRLASEQAKHRLEARIKLDPKIEIRNLGPTGQGRYAYDIVYTYTITNVSATKVRIRIASLEWLIGRPAPEGLNLFRANLPDQKGPINWERRGIEVNYEPGLDQSKLKKVIGTSTNASREIVQLEDEEGGVGSYDPDDIFTMFQTIHVVETPDKWVGFVLLIGLKVNDCNDCLEQYYDSRHVHLAATPTSSEEKETSRASQ